MTAPRRRARPGRLSAAAVAIGVALAGTPAGAAGGAGDRAGDGAMGPDAVLRDRVAGFAISAPVGARLELATVTAFDWDTVRGFPSSMPLEGLRQSLGPDFRLSDATDREMIDDSALLVFTRDDRVVAELVLAPPIHVLGLDGAAKGRDAALVVVAAEPGHWVHLRLVAAR